MTERYALTLTLTVISPFLFPGLAAGLSGFDATQLRDERNRPVLPSTQIRGLLREGLQDIALSAPGCLTEAEITLLLGAESSPRQAGEEFDQPMRGRLILGDLIADGDVLPSGETVRVEIDDELGAAKTGHLLKIELVAPHGAEISFTGTAILYWCSPEIDRIVKAIGAAIRLVPAIGAFKSAGFGAVRAGTSGARVDNGRPMGVPAAPLEPGARRGLAARFDRPILVDADRVVDNAFVGAAIVPGAVFKGALARKLALAGGQGELSRFETALANLRISHAFPEAEDGSPGGHSLPLSVVAIEKDAFGDGLRLPGGKVPLLDRGDGPMIDGIAARFAPDWKQSWFEPAATRLGRPKYRPPAMLPRTHIKIGPGGVAEAQKLYSTVARSVSQPGNPLVERRFLFCVDPGSCVDEDRERASQLIALLLDGLDGIGKTEASARFEDWAAGQGIPEPAPVYGTDNLFAVTLEADAVLTDPRTDATAPEAYAAYWAKAVPGAELVDFCASQHLAGGYLATRRRPWGDGSYHPFVLTDAGSVFLLRGGIAGRLRQLIRTGLPVPSFAGIGPGETIELDWRCCPFMPENGYGAIRADYLSEARTASMLGGA